MSNASDKKVYRLQGLSFRDELEGRPIDFENQTVYLSLVPWEICNWKCQYCHEDRRFAEEGELLDGELIDIIRKAGEIGIRSLLLLGGEVVLDTVWKRTRLIISEADSNGLVTVLYTNGSQLDQQRMNWLADHNVSLALKVDSLQEDKYDRLTGCRGSLGRTKKAIEMAKNTSIGEVVTENKNEKLVRLLFTTVGNALNIEEYVSLARFATNNGARWMMEYLNHRGDVDHHPHLSLDPDKHSEAMTYAMALNPEQMHFFNEPCRLLSCITIRKKGDIAICPQDYNFIGNIRNLSSLKEAADYVREHVESNNWRESWNGICPLKSMEISIKI